MSPWINQAMVEIIWGFILLADFLLLTVVVLSILSPKHRIWPPPNKDSWQQWVSWTLFTIVMFGVPLIGALDFRSLSIDYLLEFLVGGFLFGLGLAIDLWGTKTLSAKKSMGDTGGIITGGPYRYTRNPQYVGFIILFSGIILITASSLALIIGLSAIFLFFLIPLSEESWLRQQYGETYVNYCRLVPRFIGIRSFKPLIPKS